VSERLSSTWALIGERLAALQAILTDEAVDMVTEHYRAWKRATRSALEGFVGASDLEEFDRAKGREHHGSGRRPTPPVYLDGAASRAFLMSLRKGLEAEIPGEQLGNLKLLELLERRLGGAFRAAPRTERDLQDGFETLLAGAGIDYGRGQAGTPAFTFRDLRTALELKLCSGPGREEESVASIRRDATTWRPRHAHLIFGVYDPGFIRDHDRFARIFKSEDGVLVRVIGPSRGMKG
jgi:hypothetical protein